MHSSVPELVSVALDQPSGAITYGVSRTLAQIFPGKGILETNHYTFDLDEFARMKQCTLVVSRAVHPQIEMEWRCPEKGSRSRFVSGWRAAAWNGQLIEVLSLEHPSPGGCVERHHWIVASSHDIALRFFEAVCAYCHEVRDQVLVFSGGRWHRDADLFRDISTSTFDDLVLSGDLSHRIRDDCRLWLSSRALYEEHAVPWKRGVLFLGPPGNGKSHCIKALVGALGIPCLYVRSFAARYQTEHDTMSNVFGRARRSAPCLLVFEDLDALVTDTNRSFFLNELDGFARNTGLLSIATTNHPEKLDPAILERPSRFDRKYVFEPPALGERHRYLSAWNDRLRPAMRMTTEELDRLAEVTSGLSFAYLKELVLSSMMRWISEASTSTLAPVAIDQVGSLRLQMAARPDETRAVRVRDEDEDDDDD